MVGCGRYCLVDDALTHNSQETILMARTIGYLVKIMKQKLKVDDVFLTILMFLYLLFSLNCLIPPQVKS